MPKLKKADEKVEEAEEIQTLTAGRSRRTIKPNRKYLDSVVVPPKSPEHSDGDDTEDEYRGQEDDDDDDEEELEELERLATPSRGRPNKSIQQKPTPLSEIKKRAPEATRQIVIKKPDPKTPSTPIGKKIGTVVRTGSEQKTIPAMLRKSVTPMRKVAAPKTDEDEDVDMEEPTEQTGGRSTRSQILISRNYTSPPKTKFVVKSKGEATQKEDKPEEGTVTIVSVGEIMKNKVPVSTTPLRKIIPANAADRKRTVHGLTDASPPKIMKQSTPLKKIAVTPSTVKKVVAEDEDEIDFEDAISKSIVRPQTRTAVTPKVVKASEVKSPVTSTPRILNNNNVLKANHNGNLVKKPIVVASTQMKSPPAPRILNSSLNRSKNTSGASDSDASFSIDMTDNDNNVKLIKAPTPQAQIKKTIVTSTPIATKPGLSNNSNIINKKPTLTPVAKPPTKMKKITCFETWHVLNLPDDEAYPNERGVLEMNMISLGNRIEEIDLPSDKWAYKIGLVKLKTPLGEDDEVYTGVVEDKRIEEAGKHNYEPFNIMFRRQSAAPTAKSSFDRAVVFKKGAFYINIQGKCVRLIGSPSTVTSLEDIQVLLDIVDYSSLKTPLVELSSAP